MFDDHLIAYRFLSRALFLLNSALPIMAKKGTMNYEEMVHICIKRRFVASSVISVAQNNLI